MNSAKKAAAIGIVAVTIAVPHVGHEADAEQRAYEGALGARVEQRLELLAHIIDGSLGGLERKLARLASGGDIVG